MSQNDTVSKQRQDDEVDGGEHAAPNASLGLNAMVHDGIPVFTRQNLMETEEQTKAQKIPGGHLSGEQD